MKVIRFIICVAVIVSHIFIICDACGNDTGLQEWGRFSNSKDAKKLLSWVRCQMDGILDDKICLMKFDDTLPPYYGRYGLFVTLMKDNKVRGCYGAFSHQSHDTEATLKNYLTGALKRDSRYHPIEKGELENTRIIITIAGEQYTIDDMHAIDTARYGVIITVDNNERIVFVPSEIKSTDYLMKRFSGKEVQQVVVFRAITIKEDR